MQADTLAATVDQLPQAPEAQALSYRKSGPGRRLTQREVAILLQMAEAGKSGAEIAQALDCAESTVSRQLDIWSDKRVLARKYLEANAPKLAKTVVQSKDAATALRTLGKLDVVRDDQANSGTNVLIAIGQPGQPLSPPSVVIASLSPAVLGTQGEGPQNG